MKSPRQKLSACAETLAVLALMVAMGSALVITGRAISRTQDAAPRIALAFQEQPAAALAVVARGVHLPHTNELDCLACTNGPTTNEPSRI